MTITWKPLQITAMCQCGEEKGVASSLNKNSVSEIDEYQRCMHFAHVVGQRFVRKEYQ